MLYIPHSFLIQREDLHISTLNGKMIGVAYNPEDFIMLWEFY